MDMEGVSRHARTAVLVPTRRRRTVVVFARVSLELLSTSYNSLNVLLRSNAQLLVLRHTDDSSATPTSSNRPTAARMRANPTDTSKMRKGAI